MLESLLAKFTMDDVRDLLLHANLIEEQPDNKGHYRLVEEKPKKSVRGLGKEQKAFYELLQEDATVWHPLTSDVKRLVTSLEKRGLVTIKENQFRVNE